MEKVQPLNVPTPEKRVQARLERVLRQPRGPSRGGRRPNAEPEPEPQPETEEPEQPEQPEQPTGTATTTHGGAVGPAAGQTDGGLDPTVAEYIRDGISAWFAKNHKKVDITKSWEDYKAKIINALADRPVQEPEKVFERCFQGR